MTTWATTEEMELDATRYRALVESGLFWPGRDPNKPLVPAKGALQRWPTESLDASVDAYCVRRGISASLPIARPRKS
jgi:hypothetical protein